MPLDSPQIIQFSESLLKGHSGDRHLARDNLEDPIKPATIVVIGDTQIPFTRTESRELLRWVETGGRLVIIDRTPDRNLLPTSGEWAIETNAINFPWSDMDPNDFEKMTQGVKPANGR